MSELQLPSEISGLIAENSRRVQQSGEEIDCEYVRRGYVSVGAEIEFMQTLYGPTAYTAFLDAQSTSERFAEFRQHLDHVRDALDEAGRAPLDERDRLWNSIVSDPLLPGPSKHEILRGFFRDRHDAYIKPHLQRLKDSRLQEESNVCRIVQAPAVSLHDKGAVTLRKNICNAVMADAFGALGFVAFKSVRGVDCLRKEINSDYAIVLEPDVVSMERDYAAVRLDPSVYWHLIPYDRTCFLGSTGRKKAARYTAFRPVMNCFAAMRLHGYSDTRSLEVVIRADALWYELTIAPVECDLLRICHS